MKIRYQWLCKHLDSQHNVVVDYSDRVAFTGGNTSGFSMLK
jgi:hypothetical protein